MRVFILYSDSQGKLVEPICGSSGIPENAVTMEILCRRFFDRNENYYINGFSYDCQVFLNILKDHTKRMQNITLDLIEATMGPEYLALLIATFNKTNSLTLVDLMGDAGYTCLKSCFLQQDGPREIQFYPVKRISIDHARLLFEGLALSSTIESFVLSPPSGNLIFVDPDDAGHAFVAALGQNRSLKHIQLHSDHFQAVLRWQTFPEIFKTAILDTKVQSMDVRQASLVGQARISFETFQETLCQRDCSLEKLRMTAVAFWPPDDDVLMDDNDDAASEDSIIPNTSIKEFSLNEIGLDSPRIMETVSLLHSLVSLDLRGNSISTLSPLDPLLIGEYLTLQCLNLDENWIGEAEAVGFLRKLPQMTCLRHLSMSSNPFCWTRSYMEVLADVVWRNKSLEDIRFEVNDLCPELAAMYSQISVPLSWNRGGRRALMQVESSSTGTLPPNLWPMVLERATRICYYEYGDEWHKPSWESTQPDVVYWLLQKKILGEWLS
ncbi:unnamed protein product [Cylindrotheca closterium]|uniref:Uncharacterized protein n=1 Tax=Cylindrotheca closterium TaxID=2856 RepID=A0AAD2CUM1_9STRA|nr:unnamed protein product [Cylindrotheca closterium]